MGQDETLILLNQLESIATDDIKAVSKDYNIPEKVLKKVREVPQAKMISANYPYKTKMQRKNYEKRKKSYK